MTFRGVQLQDAVVEGRRVWFSNGLDYATRKSWLDAGYAVNFDIFVGKYYVTVDAPSLLVRNESICDNKVCDCGAKSVGSSRHSTWCSLA